MTTLGPYVFSDHDVARTLRHGVELIDLITDGLGPVAEAAAAPHRTRAESIVADVAPSDPAAALGLFWSEWREAMAAVRSCGAFGPPDVGTATGLFTSDGGVPKARVDRLEVGWGGVVGDRQGDRDNHGRPWQALCLWSTESIDHFRADGHPLAAGLAGENVSVTGLDWARVRPGVRLQLGDVLAEVSAYAVPCRKNAAWFLDGRFDAMHHRNGIHSRLYATVLEPGTIAHGDAVLLEPPG
ncbi:hypothetical protein BH10ACT1_BH10ACT1_16190 [soil metagenome]